MAKTVDDAASILILGASGSFASAVALDLLSRGSSVRLFVRDLERARRRFGNRVNAHYTVGDATSDAALAPILSECSAVVSGLDVPGSELSAHGVRLVGLLARSREREAAEGAEKGARVAPVLILPAWPSDAAGLAADPALRAAAEQGGVAVFILSFGPLFGPTVRHTLIDRACRAALEWKTIPGVGDLDGPSPWTFAPDVARRAVTILTAAGRPGACVTLIDCPPHPVSHREFLRELGSHAIRLTLPPGASMQTMNGDAEPRVGPMSALSIRIATWRDPGLRRSLEHLRARVRPMTGDVGSGHEPLAAALTRTLTSYRQGSV